MTLSLASIERVKIGTGNRHNYEKKWIRHDILYQTLKKKQKQEKRQINQQRKKIKKNKAIKKKKKREK